MSVRLAAILASLPLALGACARSHPAAATLAPATAPATVAPVPAPVPFPAASSILSGFDMADGPVQWRIGDRVLLGISFTNHDAHTERMLLVTLTGELVPGDAVEFRASSKDRPYTLESEVVRTRLTLFDETGRELDSASGRFPVKLLGFGLYDGAKWSIGSSDPNTLSDAASALNDFDHDRMMRGWLTLFSFSGSLNRKGMFHEMMRAVIARPSLLAMLFNPTIAMSSQPPGPTQGQPWSPAGEPAIETIDVPLTLTLAGKSGLIGSVTAARPVAPLSLCGGVLTASARNPDDPAVHVEISLLAAARGAGGQELVATPEH